MNYKMNGKITLQLIQLIKHKLHIIITHSTIRKAINFGSFKSVKHFRLASRTLKNYDSSTFVASKKFYDIRTKSNERYHNWRLNSSPVVSRWYARKWDESTACSAVWVGWSSKDMLLDLTILAVSCISASLWELSYQ